MAEKAPDLMSTIVSLCKRRGFIFQSSEIYGGLNSCWDYGPLGVELKRNVKEAWWRAMVTNRRDIVGLDAAILMHPKVWEASGHLAGFTDPLVDCKSCKARFRADHLERLDKCPTCGKPYGFPLTENPNRIGRYVGLKPLDRGSSTIVSLIYGQLSTMAPACGLVKQ